MPVMVRRQPGRASGDASPGDLSLTTQYEMAAMGVRFAGHQLRALLHIAAGDLVHDELASSGQLAVQVRTPVPLSLVPGLVRCGSAKNWHSYLEVAPRCVLTTSRSIEVIR
jgi:hypothetical protein